MIADTDSSFLDKLLTTQVSRMALPLGKALGDFTRTLIQALGIIMHPPASGIGGWRPSIAATLAAR